MIFFTHQVSLFVSFKKFALTVAVILAFSFASFSQTTSWTGNVSTDWSTAGNWSSGVPVSTANAIIGDASFTGTYQPTISAASVCNSLTVGGTKASTLTMSANLAASGNVAILTNGTISQNTNVLSLAGSWYNSGTYTALATGSKVTIKGTASTINGPVVTSFRKLVIAVGGITTLKTNVNIAGSTSKLTVNGTLNPNESPTYVVTGSTTGNITVGSAGVLKVNASTFAGNYTTPATPAFLAGSTVEYSATTINQTISNTLTYSTLKISGAQIKTLAGNLNALNSAAATNGNIYVSSGTLDLSTYTANRGTTTVGGTLSISNGSTLKIKGGNTYPLNFATNTLSLTSNVEYYGDNQTIAAQTYGNLVLSGTTGAVVKTLPATAFTIAGNLSSNINTASSVSYTAGSNITVTGNLNIGASTTFDASTFSHTVIGNMVNSGTLTGSTSTITCNGSGSSLSGLGVYSFNDLIISASNNTIAAATNITVNGNLSTIASGALTQLANGTLTMAGTTKTISGTGLIFNNLTCSGTISTASNLTITGNLLVNGTLNATSGNINLSGASKTITGSGTINFNALMASGSITATSNFTIGSSLDVSGSLSATAATATFTGTSTLNGTANLYNVTLNGTSLQLSTNAVLGIANVFTKTAGTLNVTSTTPNTVNYNGTIAQNIVPGTYHNLTVSNANTKTASGTLTINGDLSISASTTFVAGSYTHNLFGNWVNNGTFTAGTSTIAITGSSNTTISGATTYNVLTINKSTTNTQVSLLSNISVPTINMTNGSVSTGTNTLTITTTRTGSGIILGNIQRTHAFAANVAYEFESPNNTIKFTTVSAVTSITVKASKVAVSDFPFGGSVTRLYEMVIPAGTYNATLRLHYGDDELNGNNESAMQLWKYNGTSWVMAGKSGFDATNNYVEQTGLTAINNRFTLSDDASVAAWNGTTSSDWSNAANWTVVQGTPSLPPSSTDIAQVGITTFTNQPVISTAASIKSLLLGSAKAVSLSLTTGGSLTVNGNISGSWSTAAIHNINVNNQTLTTAGNLLLSDGTNGNAINLNCNSGTVNIAGSLTQSGSANVICSGATILNIGTDFIYTNGTFTAGTGTVVYNGTSSQNVAGINYNNLTINKASGVASLSSGAATLGNLLVTAGQLTLNSAISVAGNSTIVTGTTLNNNGVTISVGGNWINSGSYISSNGNIIFNGTGAQTIAATTFNNITINKSSGIATLNGNLVINGSLNISVGTLDIGTYSSNRTSVGGALTLSAGAVLKLSGAGNFPANFSSYAFDAASITEYNGTVPQSVAGITYGNLTLTNGGSNAKTLSASTVINGNITINSGANFNAGAYTVDLYGNWVNSGTFVPATSAVLFEGTTKTITGNTTFYRASVYGSYTVTGSDITYNSTLRVQPGASYDGGSGVATLNGDLTNSGSLISNGITNFSGNVLQTIRFTNALVSNSSGVINFNGTVSPVLNSTSTPTFATLNVNNTGGVNPSVDWLILVAFNVGTGAVFNGGNSTHTIYGTFNNNGTVTSSGTLNFVPSSSKTYGLGSSFTSTGMVIFDGTGAITTTGTPTLTDVTISNTAGVTPGSGWNNSGDFTITSDGVFNGGTNSFTVGGDIDSQGTLNGSTSTFTVTSATSQISGSSETTFYHLTISAGITSTINSDFNVAGNLTTSGTLDASGGTVVFTGASNSIISGATTPLAQFNVQKTSGAVVTLARNVTVVSAIDIVSGTLNTSTYTISQDATAGSINSLFVRNSATLKIGGTNALPTFTAYTLDSLSTVEYAGTTQTITSISAIAHYGNLTISSTGTKTANGPLNIRNNFTQTAGTFVAGTYIDTLGGNWNMSGGSFTNTGNTVLISGGGDQTILASNAFNNINIKKSSGLASISGNVTANNMQFTLGVISTGANKIIIPAGGSISGAGQSTGWINGNLQKNFSTGSNIIRIYEIGDSLNYTPVTTTLGTVSTAGDLIAATKGTDHPNVSVSSIPPTKSVNRYWTFTNSGIAFSTATVTFSWVASDVDAGVVTSNLKVEKYSGSWSLTSSGSVTSTSIQATGISSFGDFAIGEACIAGTWTGIVSTDWNLSSNWQCGILPDKFTNVIIPSGTSNFPILNNATAAVNNLTLPAGDTLIVTNGILQIAGSATTTGGVIMATSGKVEFAGSTAQIIPAGLFSANTLKDLIISNAAGVALNGALIVTGTVSFGNVNNSILASNGFLTLAASASATGMLTDITNGGVNTSNNVTGIVNVETYVKGRRAYRFLSSPVNSTGSIKANWMENTNNPTTSVNNNPVPNYGTHITGAGGAANGFDATSTNNPSLFTFNNAIQTWVAAPNANALLTAGTSYRIIVRGSRSVDLNNNSATPSATTLRAKGTLVTGDVVFAKAGGGGTAGMPELASATGGYSYIANPYACSVNWLSLMPSNTNLSTTVYIFDPSITGSNGRGGYVIYNGTQQRTSPSSSTITKDIQPGQGFFVQTNGPNPSLTFKETSKSSAFSSVFRTSDMPFVRVELLLPKQVGTSSSADEVSVYFSDDYSNSIGDDDSYKFTNQDENLAILRDRVALSLEGRKPIINSDSLPLKVWQLTQPDYTFRITLNSLGNKVQGYLVDNFLNKKSPLVEGQNLAPFSISSTNGSNATDRFKIVFEPATTLPVKLSDVKAYEKTKGVQVEWNAQSESNMDRYEVERSGNTQQFEKIGFVTAKNASGSASYNYFDAVPLTGDNYYRIKSFDKSGNVEYTEVLKVHIATGTGAISVFPNPVTGNSINVVFDNLDKGNYSATMFSSTGQKVYNGIITHNGGSGKYVIKAGSSLSKGIYQLLLSSGDVLQQVSVVVQ